MRKVSIGVAGLGFGKEFASIYCDHPDVDKVAICTRNPETLHAVGDELGICEELRFTDYDEMIALEELDAVHIVTPIKEHYPQTIRALEAGRHVPYLWLQRLRNSGTLYVQQRKIIKYTR